MEDQELGFKFIPLSARQPSWAVFAKPIPVLMVDRRSSFTTITAVVSNSSQGELEDERTRLIKELQQTKDLCMSAENLQAMSITEKDLKKRSILEPAGALVLAGAGAGAGTYCKYYGLKGGNVVATTSGANMNFDILRLLTEPADVGRQREAVLVTYMPEEPKGAGTSKGEGEDDVTVQHERKDEAGTSNRKERIEGEGDDHVTAKYLGELEDERTRLRKELQRTKDLYKSAHEKLQAMSTTEKRKYVAGTFKGKERIEGEGEDDVAAQYVRKDEAGTSKGKERIEGEGEGDVTIQHEREDEDKVTRLRKERKQMMDLYYSAYKELQAMSTKDLYCSACKESQAMSATEKRKYEAGTSKGRELIEGEGEDDATAQYIGDALGSIFKERLKDDDSLFSLSSQLPNFGRERAEEREDNFGRERAEEREDNFGQERAEEREDNFGRERAEERDHNFAWVEGLAIKFGILVAIVAPCIATYLLNKNTGKKFDDIALQIKAANEARIGTTGCASPVSYNLNISGVNVNTSVSPRLGFLNREKRGNDVEVTGSK